VRKLTIPKGPPEQGVAPYTEADPYVRTTPAEIARLLQLIEECSRGKGQLLDHYSDALGADECREMLQLLERNGDNERMLSGLPAGTRVAHKSGWVEDMQADTGVVYSPGGDFVLAIYLYQQQRNSYLTDGEAAPVIAAFARLVYSAYNPVPMK
jgi:beta-lactamase class A